MNKELAAGSRKKTGSCCFEKEHFGRKEDKTYQEIAEKTGAAAGNGFEKSKNVG